MTSAPSRTIEETNRLAEAAAWRVHLAELGVESCEAFETWLAADPKAPEAWRHVQGLWDYFDDVAGLELMAVRRDALNRALSGKPRVRRFAAPIVAAGIAAFAAAGFWVAWLVTTPQTYQTALGERRTVTLADGSHITLDSASKVEVRYTSDARKIVLARGEARFDVAHDVQRPFSVQARDRVVIATGTAFDVDVATPAVRVTLIEGHVVVLQHRTVDRSRTPPPAVAMQAGQQYIAVPDSPPQLADVSLDHETAWESGRIVVDNEPLGEVVDRVDRYAAKPVTIGDAAVAQLRLSGVFVAGDTDTFLDSVTHYLPVEAVKEPDGSVRLQQRG